MTKPLTDVLKQFVTNSAKLNMYYNYNFTIKKKKQNIINNKSFIVFQDKEPFKISKYTGYFLIFLKKYKIFKKNLLQHYHKYNSYILKKYNFLLVFIKHYLNKIFLYLKFNSFAGLSNNYYNFLLKLKFLMCYMYYKKFLRFKKPFISKKQKKNIYMNMVPLHYLIYVYKNKLKKLHKKQKK